MYITLKGCAGIGVLGSETARPGLAGELDGIGARAVSKKDEFWIKNEGLCIKTRNYVLKNDEFCIKNDEFCRTQNGKWNDAKFTYVQSLQLDPTQPLALLGYANTVARLLGGSSGDSSVEAGDVRFDCINEDS